MKTTTITLLLLFIFLNLSAQDDIDFSKDKTNANTQTFGYKQFAGSNALEINFDPGKIFGSNSGDQFNLLNGGIKYRKFSSENKAFRLGLNISYLRDVMITQQENDDFDLLELKDKASIIETALTIGTEKHFNGTKRLSPYIGFQGLLLYKTTSYKEENQDGSSIYYEKFINDEDAAGAGHMGVGIGFLAGFDYYFAKHLYLGVELGYGVSYAKKLKFKYINEDNSDLDFEAESGSTISVSPYLANGNLRLGWIF